VQRLLTAAGLLLALVTPAEGITRAPLHQSDEMIMQAAYRCGAGRTRVEGACMARTTIRHTRRAAELSAGASGGTEAFVLGGTKCRVVMAKTNPPGLHR
jgi:hypothetical protein